MRSAILGAASLLFAQPAHASCVFDGFPASFVRCIYDEVRLVAADLLDLTAEVEASVEATDTLRAEVTLGRDHCLLRSLRYQAVCAALAGSDWPMFATVSPHLSGPSHGHNGDDICRSYVGNSGIGDWTCLAVPYVYDVDEGADIRPNWTTCDAYHGSVFDEYEWFDSSDCSGMLMACCVHE